jgi:two-component system, NarL family, nitrate/nitrite response regulator NarL
MQLGLRLYTKVYTRWEEEPVDSRIRIGLVDDHPIFRAGVIHALSASANLTVVAEGRNAEDALRMAADGMLDVLLLGHEACSNGVATTRAICRTGCRPKVLLLTSSDDEDLVVEALRAGAQGYLHKDVSGFDLIRAIETIHRGEAHVAPTLASRLLLRLIAGPRTRGTGGDGADLVRLTARERQVLELLAEGFTNREIAAKLGVSIKTVKQFTMLIFSKLGVRNRVEATIALRRFHERPSAAPMPGHAIMPKLVRENAQPLA